MWYVRGKARGVAIFLVFLGVMGLLAGDFGEITWYFIGGGVVLWVVAGIIFQDQPSSQKAIRDSMNGKTQSQRDVDAFIDERIDLAKQYYGSSQSGREGKIEQTARDIKPLKADVTALQDPPIPSYEPDLNIRIDDLARSIARELESAWQLQDDPYPPMRIPKEEIHQVIKLASIDDDRFGLGAKAMLSHKVKSNLQLKGFHIG